MISTIGHKLVNLQGLPYMPPHLANFGPETAEIGRPVFAHPLNFRIGRHCQPYRMGDRQQANFGTCYVVARAYNLEQQNAGRVHAALCRAPFVLVTYRQRPRVHYVSALRLVVLV